MKVAAFIGVTMALQIASIAYLAAMTIALTGRMVTLVFCGMGIGLACSITVFTNRYLDALPMMPMHLGIVGIVVAVTLIWFCRVITDKEYVFNNEGIILQGCLVLLLAISIFFPKDFYLPFIRSLSPWAHLFFLLGILAKGFLLYGGLAPLASLLFREDRQYRLSERLATPMRLIIWGYGLLALAMFSGEIWSYLGWGTPVVWQDAAITTIIAIWFYWTCYLHLHYIRRWTAERRAVFMVVGGVLVFVLSTHPDMGPFRAVHLFP